MHLGFLSSILRDMSTNGPLSISQLIELWKTTVDPSYADSLITAGEGEGFEVYTQAFAIFARVSEAIERTRQSLFIREWSGSADSGTDYSSATGASNAEVTLLLTRSKHLEMPMYLQAGYFTVGELKNDWGENGSVPVLTGRKYVLKEYAVLHPNETGPIELKMVAERPGYGYNIPPPNSITHIYQSGAGLNNRNASFKPDFPDYFDRNTLLPISLTFSCISEPDVVVPDNIGCYLQFSQYSAEGHNPLKNHLAVWRMNKYIPAHNIDILDGGGTQFDLIVSLEGSFGFSGLINGERCSMISEDGSNWFEGRLLGIRTSNGLTRASIAVDTMRHYDVVNIDQEGLVSGLASGGSFYYQHVSYFPQYVSVPFRDNTLSWKVLSWVDDLGLSVTNPLSPINGKTDWLDELGRERNVIRTPGEGDSLYRDRVAAIDDVVTPNAIRRSANNILGNVGLSCCLREVGSSLFTGFYFDRDFFDYASTDNVWSYTKFQTWLDLLEFRGFFLVGIPPLEMGDFGFAYDATTGYTNAYDWTRSLSPISTAYDGYAVDTFAIYENVRQAVDGIRSAGVGFELYSETNNCS